MLLVLDHPGRLCRKSLQNKLNKRPNAGREEARRRVNEPNRPDVDPKGVEQRDETPAPEILGTSELRKDTDPEPTQRGGVRHRKAVEAQPPRDRHQRVSLSTAERPARRRPVRYDRDALVVAKIIRARRRPVTGEVRGAGAVSNPRRPQARRCQRRVIDAAHAKGDVEAFVHDVNATRRQNNVDVDLGPSAGVLHDEPRDEHLTEHGIGRDTQDPPGDLMGIGDRPVRVIGQAHDLRASLRIGCADLREMETTGCPMQELHIKGLLELQDPAAQGLLGDAQKPGRRREAPGLGDLGEEAHVFQLDCPIHGTIRLDFDLLSLYQRWRYTGHGNETKSQEIPMSTDIQTEVLIRRPRTQVAAFMFDPQNDAIWTTGIVDVRPLTDGRLRTGSKVERTSKFLARQFVYQYEVVDADGDRFVLMRVDEPFPMQIRYELEDSPDGTIARIHAKGDAGGFYRLAAPLLNRMARRSMTNDLEMLKEYLEGQPRS